MFLLEHVAFRKGIPVVPVNDPTVKAYLGIKFGKTEQIKRDTLIWAKNETGLDMTDDQADAVAFCYYLNKIIQ